MELFEVFLAVIATLLEPVIYVANLLYRIACPKEEIPEVLKYEEEK